MSIVEFDDTVISEEDIAFDLQNNTNRTLSAKVLTTEETKDFLDNYTNCSKVDN
jgi:hypothetical protein